ncbi:hypothetical protein ACLOJK_006563 [Asimina triloba]
MDADDKIECDGVGERKTPLTLIVVGEEDGADATGGRSVYFVADSTDPRSQPRCHSYGRLGLTDQSLLSGGFFGNHGRLPWMKMVEY